MDSVELDGNRMKTREEAHREIAAAMRFPPYYGNNLDALWDLLSTWTRPTLIHILRAEALLAQPDDYGKKILRLFQEAAEENPRLQVRAD